MGTRSTTKFYRNINGNKQFIGGIYKQFDGYISGYGKKLKNFLKGKKIINGIQNETLNEAFNGIDCLGAAVISKFKDRIGGIYLTTEDDIEDYNYKIWPEKECIFIEIKDFNEDIIFLGNINEMPETDG